MTETDLSRIESAAQQFRDDYLAVKAEIQKAVVGHDEIVGGVLTCLFAGGHALLEGVPGLGKTLLIRSLSEALRLDFNRIQFTPDLMPVGHHRHDELLQIDSETNEPRASGSRRGPIFANDRVGRRDQPRRRRRRRPRCSSRWSRSHRSPSGGKTARAADRPFFVMATQNPIEQEGTYPLPEAQLDRFFCTSWSSAIRTREELSRRFLIRTTTGAQARHPAGARRGESIIKQQELVNRIVVIAPHVQDYADPAWCSRRTRRVEFATRDA